MSGVAYKKKVIKALLRMPRPLANKFRQAFQQLADGESHAVDIKPLKGTNTWRLRIGDYRAILEIRDEEVRVLVLDIGPRGDVYK